MRPWTGHKITSGEERTHTQGYLQKTQTSSIKHRHIMPHLHTVRLSYRSYIYPLRWTPSNFVEELTRKTMRPMAKEMIFSMFSFIAHKFQPHLPSCVLKTLSLWSHVSCKSIVVAEGGGRFYLGHHHHCELCGLPSCYVWLAILSHKAAAIRQNQAATSIYLFIHPSIYLSI